MKILGVRVDNLSRKEILEKIESFLDEPEFHQICTVNAEFIIEAQKNELFKNILNKADLNVADAISIRYAFLRYGKWLKCRFTGADLMHEILKIANRKKLCVFLAANKNGLSTWQETATALQKLYPQICFGGENIKFKNISAYQMPDTKYQILFCSLGAPGQELFINNLKSDSIRLAMGVGGAFDFVTGKVRRTPGTWRKFGLEWLWRFIQEPSYRAKRIFNAVIVFPIKIIFSKKMTEKKVEVIIAQGDVQIAEAMEIRKKVFQQEQGIDASLDFDGKDQYSDHFIATMDDLVVGTGRVRYSFDNERKIAKVERMAVLKEQRGQGIGDKIMQAMHEYLKGKGVIHVNLDSQEQVKGFYEKMGYVQEGEVFEEVGRPHIKMTREL